MNQDRQQINYSQYQASFDNRCERWRSQPVKDRKLNDTGCLVALALMVVGFIGIGGYYIALYNSSYRLQSNEAGGQLDLAKYTLEIATCVAFSLALCFLYISLIKLFPRIMVFLMIGLTLGLLAILIVVGLIIDQIALAISAGVTLLIYGIMLACFRQKILTGIVLIKVAGNFISARPSVFLTPLPKIVITGIIGIVWLWAISAMLYIGDAQQQRGEQATLVRVLTGVYVIFWLFFTFFFYYMMVFTIAVSCAHWYYGIEGNAMITAYKWFFKYHIGSVTFAALFIAIITFARMMMDGARRNKKNAAVAICACILYCILRQLEALIKILNNNTIIVMSVTGESFIDGAKTAIGLLSQNLPLLAISNMISGFLVFWGVIFTAGLPAILAYIMIGGGNDDLPVVIGLVITFSIMLSVMVLSVLVESVGSVYVFYCFDKKFREQGYNANNMPPQIYNELSGFQGYGAPPPTNNAQYDRY